MVFKCTRTVTTSGPRPRRKVAKHFPALGSHRPYPGYTDVRLNALSRVSTSTTVLYGSVKRVVEDATGHQPFVMSCSSTKPKELDDKVEKLHLPAFEMSCSFTIQVPALFVY